MRVEGNLLKETLLNGSKAIDNNLSPSVSPEKSQIGSATNVRASSGFPRTNVEKTYKDQLTSMEEMSQAAENQLLAMTHQNLDYIARTVTPGDAKIAAESGFLPENTTPEGYVTVIDKIKIHMAMGNDDFENYGETLDASQIAQVTGSSAMARSLAGKMAENDIPVTEENVNDAMKAVSEGTKIAPLSEGDKKYLISNDMLPTIENLYKAEHASTTQTITAANNPAMVAAEAKTTLGTISDEVWADVEAQAATFIEEADLPVNEDTLAAARWLMANEIPIEADTLYAKEFYDNLKLPATVEELGDAVAFAMNRGKKPMEGLILGDNLELKYITTRKVLAEARVVMTFKASKTMMDNGITPDMEELSKIAMDLEQDEKDYYASLMKSEGIDVTEEKLSLLLDTLEYVEDAKVLPEYILGRKPLDMTLPEVVREGNEVKATLDAVTERYETVMTRPRADMGDSISRAFRNIPDILTDLGFEVNAENAKAVRVLAYNSMPLTPENITNIRNVNMAVTETLEAVKPQTVLHMIKNDINPLGMTMGRLRNEALAINEANDFEGTEKYSEFLWKTQNAGNITPEERDSFIGIYRMLRSIEKTDGAVVGALVAQGADLTIKNLMMAVRTRKNSGVDVSVNDTTAIPVANKENVNAFTMQAESAFTREHPGQEDTAEAEVTYHQMLSRKLTADMTPQALKAAGITEELLNGSLSNLLEQMAAAREENPEIIREEAELDLRYEQLRLNRFENACMAEDDVLRLLSDNDLPMNLYNIMAAREIMGRRSSRYDRMFKASDAADMEAVKNKILHKLGENIKTPYEMAEAMDTLGDIAENVMKGMIYSDDTNFMRLQSARMMNATMSLTMDLAQKEHYDIPVLVGDEVAGVSLKIVRGKRDKGKVDVVFDLGRNLGGKVAAELIVKDNSFTGMIAAENKEMLDKLAANREGLINTLAENIGKEPEFRFAVVPDLNIDKFLQGESITDESTEEEQAVQTRQLYGAAKEFMSYVKASLDR